MAVDRIAAVVMPAIGGALWMIDYHIPFIAGALLSPISLLAVPHIPRFDPKKKDHTVG